MSSPSGNLLIDLAFSAHIIRRQATKLNRTVSEISAKSRWCLTGTPIQNRLEDIGTLFAFIRAKPFDSLAVFRRFIAIPFDEGEERRSTATWRLSALIDSVCIRRTREILQLPEGRNEVRIIKFSKEEREQYEQTKQTMIRAIRHQAGEYDKNSVFGMFQAQLQLRILCNHGTFQQHFSWARARRDLVGEKEDTLCSLGLSNENTCSSCGQSIPVLSSESVYPKYGDGCNHTVCSECREQNGSKSDVGTNAISQCPMCSFDKALATNEAEDVFSSEDALHDDYFHSQGHSSKMKTLLADVRRDLWDNKRWRRSDLPILNGRLKISQHNIFLLDENAELDFEIFITSRNTICANRRRKSSSSPTKDSGRLC